MNNEEKFKKLIKHIDEVSWLGFIKEIEQLKKENKQLKERISKAIEYIKENGCYDEKINLFNDNIYYFELSELLEILKGDNND